MKRTLCLFFVCAAALGVAQGQREMGPKPSRASWVYEQGRLKIVEPPFALAKVKRLLKKRKDLKSPSDMMIITGLPDAMWSKLSTEEKFTYCMLDGEVDTQVCDAMSALIGEEHLIFAQPAPAFGSGDDWSDRQKQFLHAHRGTCLTLLRKTIKARHQVGSNVTGLILELKLKELVPELVTYYNADRRDLDLLSTLLSLMQKDGFVPLTKQPWYTKLYGENASWQSTINASKANVKTIERLALAYAKG